VEKDENNFWTDRNYLHAIPEIPQKSIKNDL
jgi:hypothetical protein